MYLVGPVSKYRKWNITQKFWNQLVVLETPSPVFQKIGWSNCRNLGKKFYCVLNERRYSSEARYRSIWKFFECFHWTEVFDYFFQKVWSFESIRMDNSPWKKSGKIVAYYSKYFCLKVLPLAQFIFGACELFETL